MSGKISFLSIALIFISVFAAVTDFLWRKIFNLLTVPAALAGFLFSLYYIGLEGLGDSLLGFCAGFVLYGWMYGLNIVGGGDVKLLMALGAWGGFRFSVEVAVLGVLIGGAISFLILLFAGRLVGFVQRMYVFLLSVVVHELEFQAPKVDQTLTMPFGISISIAAIWTNLSHPLNGLLNGSLNSLIHSWGFQLWR